jgi:hypothetical protein
MSKEGLVQEMSLDDRLRATLFQFIKLYERWSEDRQEAAKQAADMDELVALFTAQVESFKELVPQTCKYLGKSIRDAASNVVNLMGEEISKGALSATELVVKDLARTTEKAENTLACYQKEVVTTQWKVIGISVLTTIATSLLLVWLLIPKPTQILPFTNTQIKELYDGKLLALVWPKLSKKEQDHWLELVNQIAHPR